MADGFLFPVCGSDDPLKGVATTRILTLAGNQFGIISRTQLRDDLGVGRSTISRMTGDGRLVSIMHGVYRLASAVETFEARCMATQLWAGGHGFVSSWSAARVCGLRLFNSDRVHFTVPVGSQRPSTTWVHLDRTSWYDAEADRATLANGLVVATPLRMLFGLAADVNQFRFDRAAEDAWHRKLTDPTKMASYLAEHRGRGRDGVARMEAFLDKCADRVLPAQSGFEQDVITALERVLPPVVRQFRLTLVNGEVVKLDIAWPELRLAVEPGASWFHGGDAGQARDHDRDLACNEVGWMIIRLDESFRRNLPAAARRVKAVYRRREHEAAGNLAI